MARTTVQSAVMLITALSLGIMTVVAIGHRDAGAQGACEPGATGQACAAPGSPATRRPATLIGAKAPSLSGPNLVAPGTLELAPMLTRPTAVVFWLNTCPHCRREMPRVERLSKNLTSDAQIVSAAIDAGLEGRTGYKTPADAVKSMHLTLPTILVSELQAQSWRVRSTPTAFVLDADGNVVSVIPLGSGDFSARIMRGLAHVP